MANRQTPTIPIGTAAAATASRHGRADVRPGAFLTRSPRGGPRGAMTVLLFGSRASSLFFTKLPKQFLQDAALPAHAFPQLREAVEGPDFTTMDDADAVREPLRDVENLRGVDDRPPAFRGFPGP